MRLLLIEDEFKIASHIKQSLRSQSFVVDSVENGKTGYLKANSINYDLLLIDIGLPDISGLEVVQKLRNNKNETPIIIVTGENEIETKLKAYSNGIDDYIIKPFSLSELTARIRAVLRRSTNNNELNNIIKIGDLTIDMDKRIVMRNEKIIRLPKKQYMLLLFMAQKKGTALTRSCLLEHVWEKNLDLLETTVDVHMFHLRDKIDKKFTPKLIHTVHGVGYKLDITE